MKKLLLSLLLFALPLIFNSCKSKLFGYDDKISSPVEKLCLINSTTDSTSANAVNYIYNGNHMPLKGYSSDKRTIYTYEYDGRGRWEKYLYESTDSSNYLLTFKYNDTTNLIKEIYTYTSYINSNNFFPSTKSIYFYDSLNRVVLIDKYINGEGWYKSTTSRLVYNSKNNLTQIYLKDYNSQQPEYLHIEFTEYDDKINFLRTSSVFQLQNIKGITTLEDDRGAPIPNFSKNNPIKGKFYTPKLTTGYDLNYEYVYNLSGLPVNSILEVAVFVRNSKQILRINTHFNYYCSN